MMQPVQAQIPFSYHKQLLKINTLANRLFFKKKKHAVLSYNFQACVAQPFSSVSLKRVVYIKGF